MKAEEDAAHRIVVCLLPFRVSCNVNRGFPLTRRLSEIINLLVRIVSKSLILYPALIKSNLRGLEGFPD